MRAYAHGLTMAVACVAFSLAFVPAIAYADEVPCGNEGDNASHITQTADAENPDESAGGEQGSSTDALQAGNDIGGAKGEPIVDGAEAPEFSSPNPQPTPVDEQPQTSDLLETTPESTSKFENKSDARSDLSDRTADFDEAARCADNEPAPKSNLTAPKSQEPAPTGEGDENVTSRSQVKVMIDYKPVPKNAIATLEAYPNSEIGSSAFELYWQHKPLGSQSWIDVRTSLGELLMAQSLCVPTNNRTIGEMFRACMRVDDPVTGECVEVYSDPVTITEGYGFASQIEFDPPAPGGIAIFVARVSGIGEAERADVWYEWQIWTDDGNTWTSISGSGTNADEHKAQLYVPTVKRGGTSSDDWNLISTLIRVIVHASDGRTAISDPVMLTTQSDEGDGDWATDGSDPILLTTPGDTGDRNPARERKDPTREDTREDAGGMEESQPAIEAHHSASAVYGAPAAPDRNVPSTLPSTGDAVPFEIPAAVAAIAALVACVSFLVRRKIEAQA